MTPLGSWTEWRSDAIGRVAETRAPIRGDTVQSDTTVCDAGDRVARQESRAPMVQAGVELGRVSHPPAASLQEGVTTGRVMMVAYSGPGGRAMQTTEITDEQRKRLQAMNIELPKRVHHIG